MATLTTDAARAELARFVDAYGGCMDSEVLDRVIEAAKLMRAEIWARYAGPPPAERAHRAHFVRAQGHAQV